MSFKKYKLTDEQIVQLARLCVQEQGSITGARAEASLMCNQLETSDARQKRYGTDGDALYNWVRNGKWYYRAAYYMEHGYASSKAIEAVRDVICNGNRCFPQYIDEHDCISDIKTITRAGKTYNKSDRNNYIQNETVIKNNFGSRYTFYCFPASGADPFGYTAAAYSYVREHGGAVEGADNSGGTAYCNGQDVNFRKAPKFGDNVIFTLSRGETVKILSTDGKWTRCTYHGVTGYVWAKYLTWLPDVKGSFEDVALRVINGEYGNGENRKASLRNAGYTDEEIKEIQKTVNSLLKR